MAYVFQNDFDFGTQRSVDIIANDLVEAGERNGQFPAQPRAARQLDIRTHTCDIVTAEISGWRGIRMRTIIMALAAISCAAGAQAQTATPAAKATPAATAAHYATSSTEIGTLLDDPAARALLDKHIPGMTGNPQVDMARAMTLKDVQQYSPDLITDKVLADLDADFAKIPTKSAK